MAKKQTDCSKIIEHVAKKTTIGDGRISWSTMNKHKDATLNNIEVKVDNVYF